MPSVFYNRPSSLSIGSYFSLKKMKEEMEEDFVIIIIVLVLFILVVIVAVMQWFIDICRLCVTCCSTRKYSPQMPPNIPVTETTLWI
jgi:flagellar basal body-associated protein FliL